MWSWTMSEIQKSVRNDLSLNNFLSCDTLMNLDDNHNLKDLKK